MATNSPKKLKDTSNQKGSRKEPKKKPIKKSKTKSSKLGVRKNPNYEFDKTGYLSREAYDGFRAALVGRIEQLDSKILKQSIAVDRYLRKTGHELCHESRRELARSFELEYLISMPPGSLEEFAQGCSSEQRAIYGKSAEHKIILLHENLDSLGFPGEWKREVRGDIGTVASLLDRFHHIKDVVEKNIRKRELRRKTL